MNAGKKALSLLLAAIISLPFCAPAAGAEGDGGNFRPVNSYRDGLFSDVAQGDWYTENVALAYELGLMKGSGGAFHVSGQLTVAESVAVAARIHSIYYADGESFVQGTPWYRVYVDYALQNGILTAEYPDYEKAATRAAFASIAAKALPEEALPAVNDVPDCSIPDVSMYDSFAGAVYALYRAGVLTGDGKNGAFSPYGTIDRGSAAAIITRLADQSLRKNVSLAGGGTETLTAEKLMAKCAPAIFIITCYDAKGLPARRGIGAFLTSSGLAVTDLDSFDSYSARITLPTNGTSYHVKGIYQMAEDMVILQVDGSGFPWLNLCDYDALQVGDAAYLIGNENGKTNAIGEQRLSVTDNEKHVGYEILNRLFSDYSVLVSSDGKLIGIASPPPSFILLPNGYAHVIKPDQLMLRTFRPMMDYWLKENSAPVSYPECAYIPDFGAFFNLEPFEVVSDETTVTYYYYCYDLESMWGLRAQAIDERDYGIILKQVGYRASTTSFKGDDVIDTYTNSTVSEAPNFTLTTTKRNEQDCIAIRVPVQGADAAE